MLLRCIYPENMSYSSRESGIKYSTNIAGLGFASCSSKVGLVCLMRGLNGSVLIFYFRFHQLVSPKLRASIPHSNCVYVLWFYFVIQQWGAVHLLKNCSYVHILLRRYHCIYIYLFIESSSHSEQKVCKADDFAGCITEKQQIAKVKFISKCFTQFPENAKYCRLHSNLSTYIHKSSVIFSL